MTYTDGSPPEKVYEDSSWAIPLIHGTPTDSSELGYGGRFLLYRDFRQGKEGWWIVFSFHHADTGSAAQSLTAPSLIGPVTEEESKDSTRALRLALWNMPKFLIPALYAIDLEPEGKFLLYKRTNGELWKISLPDGREVRLPAVIPGAQASFGMGTGTKEIIYVESGFNSKLVMIDNLF